MSAPPLSPANFDPKLWHDPIIADAVCDRILHSVHRLVLKGPSRRKEAAEK